eukprot:361055-Chlamydomonas_euryale.AAC.2
MVHRKASCPQGSGLDRHVPAVTCALTVAACTPACSLAVAACAPACSLAVAACAPACCCRLMTRSRCWCPPHVASATSALAHSAAAGRPQSGEARMQGMATVRQGTNAGHGHREARHECRAWPQSGEA